MEVVPRNFCIRVVVSDSSAVVSLPSQISISARLDLSGAANHLCPRMTPATAYLIGSSLLHNQQLNPRPRAFHAMENPQGSRPRRNLTVKKRKKGRARADTDRVGLAHSVLGYIAQVQGE